jgi:hypothetical protein
MRIVLLVTVAMLALPRDSARAQDVSFMAQAIPVVTRADPTATRTALTEGYVSQPAVMAHASYGWLQARGTLNLEGLTLQRGELSTGGYGEGYVDRRHPHAYLHELLVGAEHTYAGVDGSLFVGRGFAPFGSDDPMVRPFEKYPVNHHLAQVLERVVAIAAVRKGPVIGELGTFNGDEPTAPGASPNFNRFGDSWAARLTVAPFNGAEVSASTASVTSPEVRAGHGLDQRKTSLVARFSRETPTSWRYALVEYAHTGERDHGALASSLSSVLGEAAYCTRGVVVAARGERTDRPEEEQLSDPFRTPRPSVDLSNLGISRWTILTASLSSPAARLGLASARPFVEVARIAVGHGEPTGVFNPTFRYGTDRMWMISAGIRLRAGTMHDRMGRYGAALPSMTSTAMASMNGGMPGMGAQPGMMPGMDHQMATGRCTL